MVEPLDRTMTGLEARLRRNPTRPGALAGVALAVVELVVMLGAGGTDLGGHPLAERLLAWTVALTGLTAVAGGVLWLLPSQRRRGLVVLSAALAGLVAVALVLVAHRLQAPLHLEDLLD